MNHKIDVIIDSIYENLQIKYHILYGKSTEEMSLEYQILKEVIELKTRLSIKETLLFSNSLLQLDYILASKEQKLWRNFVFCHLVFLFGKKMFSFDTHLLTIVCDSITRKNMNKDFRYLMLLTDKKWMKNLYEYILYVDFSSHLNNQYRINFDRIETSFLNLCEKIEKILTETPEEIDMEIMKKEVFKKVKKIHQISYLKGV